MGIIEHDGKTYLVQNTMGAHREWNADFDVIALEVTAAILAEWRRKIALAKQLKADHGVAAITFVDTSATYYGANEETVLDDDLDMDETPTPLWTPEPGRTECEVLDVTGDGVLSWSAYIKNTDSHVTMPGLWEEDLDTITARLAARR